MTASSRNTPLPDLAAAIDAGDAERMAVHAALSGRRAQLPLRYWRQHAHLTCPTADPTTVRKAIEGGSPSVARILDRLHLTSRDLADHLELPVELVDARLHRRMRAPVVMLDGEDGAARGKAIEERGIVIAADAFAGASWGYGGTAPLRFYRPPGFNLDTTVRNLYTLLWRLRERTVQATAFPLDGIVFPKVEHREEASLVNNLLDRAEHALGLPLGGIRVVYLIESGWAMTQLPSIAIHAAPRLAGFVLGLADLSADLGLRTIRNDHALADWARAEIVGVAGAVGVPAIDGMTLDYPVRNPTLTAAADRAAWLDRMRLVYDDAIRAIGLGMAGKWVGHPAQLLAVLLAFEASFSAGAVEGEAAKLEAYAAALAAERGGTTINGVMSDRATERHAREFLRRATALGFFEPGRVESIGIISAEERGQADSAFARTHDAS